MFLLWFISIYDSTYDAIKGCESQKTLYSFIIEYDVNNFNKKSWKNCYTHGVHRSLYSLAMVSIPPVLATPIKQVRLPTSTPTTDIFALSCYKLIQSITKYVRFSRKHVNFQSAKRLKGSIDIAVPQKIREFSRKWRNMDKNDLIGNAPNKNTYSTIIRPVYWANLSCLMHRKCVSV